MIWCHETKVCVTLFQINGISFKVEGASVVRLARLFFVTLRNQHKKPPPEVGGGDYRMLLFILRILANS